MSDSRETVLRHHTRLIGPERASLIRAAEQVLQDNWVGASTVPSRSLYPHQWSWDAAFISIGRSWFDEPRARLELLTLFDAQWSNGMVPHIVFDQATPADAYFPGPDFWDAGRSGHAPRRNGTSGITQPPIHARAVWEMHQHAKDVDSSLAFLRTMYPRLVAQHDYLARDRDPTGIGLPAIVHPWESGLDDSPAWDRLLGALAIAPADIPAYRRFDLDRADPADRPTNATYDAFVYLAARYRDSDYRDADLLTSAPFLIAGPLFSAIYLWSTHALADIAVAIGQDPGPHRAAAVRISTALMERLWDAHDGAFYPRDLHADRLQPEETIVSFAPLLDPALPVAVVDALCARLESICFHPEAPGHFLIPTYSVRSPGFDVRRYWRGPVWLNTNWLLWHGLRLHGRLRLAEEIAASSIALVARSGFREYFEPFDGSGHGTDDFSWSAALAIDFLRRPA